MKLLIPILVGYLIGSIPFSYLVVKLFGHQDIRKVGSGNVGTTNVARSLGIPYAVLAYVLDMSKGLLAFFIIRHFYDYGLGVLASAFAVIGHCYSVWLSFKGGKGIAVSSGFLLASSPVVALILIGIQLIMVLLFRRMSLASIISALCFPVVTYLINGVTPLLYVSFFMAPFVIFQHRENIKRLIQGKEKKLF